MFRFEVAKFLDLLELSTVQSLDNNNPMATENGKLGNDIISLIFLL